VTRTAEVDSILAYARERATARGWPGPALLDIWYAVTDDAKAAAVLTTCNVDIAALQRWLDAVLANAPIPQRGIDYASWFESLEKVAGERALGSVELLGRMVAMRNDGGVGNLLAERGVARADILTFIAHGTMPVAGRAVLPRAELSRRARGASVPGKGLYRVVAHNDDYTTFEMVLTIFTRVFGCEVEEGKALASRIHQDGSSEVGIYLLADAVERIDEATAFARYHGFPLRLTFQPAD